MIANPNSSYVLPEDYLMAQDSPVKHEYRQGLVSASLSLHLKACSNEFACSDRLLIALNCPPEMNCITTPSRARYFAMPSPMPPLLPVTKTRLP